MLNRAIYKSPIGDLYLYSDNSHLVGLYINAPSIEAKDNIDEILEYTKCWLDAYFNGKYEEYALPLKIEGSEFYTYTMTALQTILIGEVRSYKEIGKMVEKLSGKRVSNQAVGSAIGRNKIAIIIPCHRVIKSDGSIGNFRYSKTIKKALLEHEKH